MSRESLLSIVQGILSDTDGDEVNSISDTIESDQCARVVRDEFWHMIDDFDIKMHESIQRLDATSSATPTKMTRPTEVHKIETIWYNKKTDAGAADNYQEVHFKDPADFLASSFSLSSTDTNVDQYYVKEGASETLNLNVRNDQHPTYWTILEGYDDIYFDSYYSTLDSSLQNSKSLVKGLFRPTFSFTDAYVPDIPENMFTLLKDRARNMYFELYKDGAPQAVARRERQSEVRAQRKKYITKDLQEKRTGPNYGRNAR